jgi:hypothetical protein
MMCLLLVPALMIPAGADLLFAQSAAARRAAREIVETFGREAVERAEPRVVRLIEEYGDDAVKALRRAGPPAVHALETYGAAGAKILARWGDDGVRLLAVEGEAATSLLAKFGDDAVGFMIKHPGAGRDLLEHFGAQALRAPLSTESVVTLNRLAAPIKGSGRAAELFGVIERFGDRACAFLWRNKGTVFATAVLVSFLADPQPYLDGVKQLVVQPATQAFGEVARRTNWTAVISAGVLAIVAAAFAAWQIRRRRTPAASARELA